MIRRGRKVWTGIHKWIGLLVGGWFAIQGLMGAVLVYKLELQASLDPQLYRTGHVIDRIDYDGMLEVVEKTFPEWHVNYLERDANAPDESIRFILSPVGKMSSPLHDLEVFVDPRDNTIIDSRPWATFVKTVWSLHTGLIAGRTGEGIVGYMGIALLISLVTGIVLWWPRPRMWKRSLRISRSTSNARFIFDLHTVTGAYIVVVLLVLVLSGLSIIFPGKASSVLSLVTEMRPSSDFTTDVLMPGVPREQVTFESRQSLNRFAETVEYLYPKSDVTLVLLPHNSEKGTYTFRLIPESKDRTRATTQVYFDPKSGEMIGRFEPSMQPWGNTLIGLWAVYLHTGEIWGVGGRMLVLFTGLVLALLFVTGCYLWIRKRHSRKPSLWRRWMLAGKSQKATT